MAITVYHPICGNHGVHKAHLHWNQDFTLAMNCGGYSPEQCDIGDMMSQALRIRQVYQLACVELPDDVRLEVSPSVLSVLTANVVPTFEQAVGGPMDPDFPVFEVPGLDDRGWRIVIGRGEISGQGSD